MNPNIWEQQRLNEVPTDLSNILIIDVKSRKMEEAGPVPPPKGVLHYLKSEVGGELNSPTDE
ncbi:MAG: hypothetical protein EAX87_07380 [Candidatus Thorarchaeota archaeon]|nr:hypothetical protein [Candidatus Thorarchaeota archaeon]